MSRAVLQFSTTNHIGSRLIRWGTWSDFSHVDLVVPDGRLYGAVKSGVDYHVLPDGTVRVERLRLDVPADELLDVLLTQRGKPYDYGAIMAWPFRVDWRDPEKWFCSELIAWGCEQLGRPLVRPVESVNRIVPRDVYLSILLSNS